MALFPTASVAVAGARHRCRTAFGAATICGCLALAATLGTTLNAQTDDKTDPPLAPPIEVEVEVKPGDTAPNMPAPSAPDTPTAPDTPAAPVGSVGSVTSSPEITAAPSPTTGAPVAAPDLTEALTTALTSLGGTFDPDEAAAFADMLASDLPQGVTGDTLGHLLFMRRHFDRAAWFFGQAALRDPGRVASLANFAALIALTYEDAGSGAGSDSGANAPDAWLAAALAAAQAADAMAPDTAAILNNLGNIARLAGDLDRAVQAGQRAANLAPDEPLYWTNLARSHAAGGDMEAAAAALARAHRLDPNGLAVLETAAALPGAQPAYTSALSAQCNVDFACQQICPRSIIGGLMSVTCEMENMSAQLACGAGQPYPTSYDCTEDLPEYGILIPGLNSGFSIAVPGFSMHVLIQGDGRVDMRVEAGASILGPIGGYVRGDGHYAPTNGASFDNLGGGLRVSVFPSSPAGQMASDLGHPPIHIEAEQLDGQPPQINLEAYNAGLISY